MVVVDRKAGDEEWTAHLYLKMLIDFTQLGGWWPHDLTLYGVQNQKVVKMAPPARHRPKQ
jgi:hypothetical protein